MKSSTFRLGIAACPSDGNEALAPFPGHTGSSGLQPVNGFPQGACVMGNLETKIIISFVPAAAKTKKHF